MGDATAGAPAGTENNATGINAPDTAPANVADADHLPTDSGSLQAALPPTPPSASDTDAPSVGQLVGIDERRASELLGKAAETNDQSPGLVWRYKGAGCELDLVFYLELRTGQMRTLHYEFKGAGDDAQKQRACLSTIVAGRRAEHS